MTEVLADNLLLLSFILPIRLQKEKLASISSCFVIFPHVSERKQYGRWVLMCKGHRKKALVLVVSVRTGLSTEWQCRTGRGRVLAGRLLTLGLNARRHVRGVHNRSFAHAQLGYRRARTRARQAVMNLVTRVRSIDSLVASPQKRHARSLFV